ncbi:MAG: thiamine diphosphokinase [Clostridia bacterium]|nr:thiamine diphosphokinase [Clostridia bacterium]
MRAYIFAGGVIDPANIYCKPGAEDLTIAADSGWHNALALGITPQILLGDFDSIGADSLPEAKEILQVPAEKDRTDTQLAVDLALSRGAHEMVIVGGLGGRLDHALSNLGVLEMLSERHVHAILEDGFNRVRFLRNTGALIARSAYQYLSVLAADKTVKGVSVDGCKYPLKGAKLSRACGWTVSNEITGNCALVEVRRGGIFVLETK